MSVQETINHLENILNKNQADFSSGANAMLGEMSGESSIQKKNRAKLLISQISRMKELAPESKFPKWLSDFSEALDGYLNNSLDSSKFIRLLIEVLPEISRFRWVLDDSSSSGFDFESIFNECRLNSRVPELFGSIIELLEQIRDSGELDSRNMIDALSKIISTLQVGKTSTYFSMEGAWRFLCGFLENYFWIEAKKIPGLGPVVEALEKTIKDTQEEMSKLNVVVQTTMTERVKAEVKYVRDRQEPLFINYDAKGHMLPDATSKGGVDIQA
ncbi:hypothetical protein [Pseudomonas asplenii]|nr:hypothetical protein [Pseudomonas fuscovaginae]